MPLIGSVRASEIPTQLTCRAGHVEEEMSSDSDSPETSTLSGWAVVTPHGDVEVILTSLCVTGSSAKTNKLS